MKSEIRNTKLTNSIKSASKLLASAALSILLASSASTASAQSSIYGHLNAGAVSQDAGAPLLWVNGSIFATNSGYAQLMPLSTAGTYAGYYNSGPTMTALPTSTDNGGPAPFAALQGSFLNAVLTLYSAPAGGLFNFWDAGATSPSFNLNVGDSTGLIALSDETLGAGNAGADPYGHIHGRKFSATLPGDYIIGLQLFDTSPLGPGANPQHTPSDILYMKFTAVVPEPSSAALFLLGGATLFVTRSKRLATKRVPAVE